MGQDQERTPYSCDGKPMQFHIAAGRRIIRHGYDTDRIPDATPMRTQEKRALRDHKFCVASAYRDRISTYRDRSSRRYARKLAKATAWPTPESLGVSSATLEAIASCESGGDPTAVDPSGTYYGKYQFDFGTWASVGGSGNPAAASEDEQDYRAALLYRARGSAPWPVCGR